MARVEYSFAKLAIARAHFKQMESNGQQMIAAARLQLAILSILEEAGGQMTALDLMTEVIKKTGDTRHTPFQLCAWIRKKPEDTVELAYE